MFVLHISTCFTIHFYLLLCQFLYITLSHHTVQSYYFWLSYKHYYEHFNGLSISCQLVTWRLYRQCTFLFSKYHIQFPPRVLQILQMSFIAYFFPLKLWKSLSQNGTTSRRHSALWYIFSGASTRFRVMSSPYGASRWPSSDTPHSVGLLWTNDKPASDAPTWQHTTLK